MITSFGLLMNPCMILYIMQEKMMRMTLSCPICDQRPLEQNLVLVSKGSGTDVTLHALSTRRFK